MQQSSVNAGFELSPQQKMLWSWQPDAIVQVVLLLEGKLDIKRLRDALRSIVERHEILRTTFQRNSGMKFPFQVVNAGATLAWDEIRLETGEEDQLEQLLARKPQINFAQGPALHGSLATGSEDRHFLVLSVPGLCADSATLRNLCHELCESYAGSAQGGGDSLQYADYSEWQNELLRQNGEETQEGRDHWARHDDRSIPKLALPFEHKRDGESLFAPQSVPVPLDRELLHQHRWSKELCDLLLACWQILLWRTTGQPELVISYTSVGRNHEETKGAFGLFAKSLPLYPNFDSDSSVARAVAQARQAKSETEEWQDYFVDGDDLPAAFSVEQHMERREAGGVTFQLYRQRCFTHRFRLQLRCVVDEDSWNAEVVHDPACFHRDTAEQIARRFAILFAGAATNLNSSVSALPIMDENERRQVLVTFNQTKADYPRDKCIPDLFEEQAKRTPERQALRFGERQFSYADLNARSNQIAHLLRKRGVKANVPVGLCVERSAEMIIGLLGILKAGGCYVPLVPDNPKARLAHQLAETAAPVVLTQEGLVDRLPEFSGATIRLDRDLSLLEKESTSNLQRNNAPDDLAYVIYTSGSTGIPKGVAVRHFNLVNYSHFICRRLQLEEHPQGLNFATVSTISADLGNTCIFPSLISGGCLHVIGYEMAMAANLFANYAAQHPIDVLKITPSHLTTLLNAAEGKAILPRKYLVLGGEASSWHLIDRIRKARDCAVINHYGPTEATVGCCTFAINENDVSAWAPATVPIGRPIANDEIYILDQRLEPVPVGVAGELCIGGTGLAKGYLNQPQQTAERFLPHPFSNERSARLYRTGDLARFLPDGNVEFLGRIDQQVKIRGFRVEPAEIEAVLKQHPAVKQSAIVAYEDKSGERRLAAYVVSAKQLKSEELRAFLSQQLPEYMVPSAFIALEKLPLTVNGKIDVRAMPSPEESQSKVEREFVGARNSEEESLVAIWTEVLKLERIGVKDNFFELGGHSLLATQIISRIRNTFRVQFPLHSFLETPTIAGVAEKISECPAVETEEEEMARLLQELEGVSEEEAERLLASETENGGNRGLGGKNH